MARSGDIVIDSVLCFLSSARNDHPNDSLVDIASAFYSHEEIKSAKVEITNILNKDISWRRDPEKKKKDMKDVVDFHNELLTSKKKVTFVTDSYKKMPPVGMELIAPVMVNLSEEMAKINDLLPKILDIKTEVTNTADTARQLRIDINNLKETFSQAINGLNEASKDIVDNDLNILEDIRSFRHSFGVMDGACGGLDEQNRGILPLQRDLFSEKVKKGDSKSTPKRVKDKRQRSPAKENANQRLTGAIPKKRTEMAQRNHHESVTELSLPDEHDEGGKEENGTGDNGTGENETGESGRGENGSGENGTGEVIDDGGAWVLVEGKRRQQRKGLRGHQGVAGGAGGTNPTRVTGSGKTVQQFRAVKRTADVYVGRVDCDVALQDIEQYVKEHIEINIVNIIELDIKTDRYKAFKITLAFNDREKLFNSDLWPEDIVVDKFYNRSRK